MRILLIIVFAALPLVFPYLYSRLRVLSLFFNNAPDRLPQTSSFASYEIKFADDPRIRSCEDALIVKEEGVAIVGCDPGREKWNMVLGIYFEGESDKGGIWVYDYASGSDSLKEVELINHPDQEVHLLGIAYHHATKQFFAVNHARTGSRIDAFTLDLAHPSGPRATYERSISHPKLLRAPNSLAPLPNGRELYVTNDHRFPVGQYGVLASKVEEYLALPVAPVVHVDLETGNVTEVARVPFANGVEMLNETTLAVASTSSPALFFFSVDPETKGLTERARVPTPFFPDNLNVDGHGVLLVAGHPHPPSLTAFSSSRAPCHAAEVEGDEAKVAECRGIKTGSWVAEWTEAGGLRDLYTGTEYPTTATADRDIGRKVGIVTGLYSKGLLVWRE